MPSVSSRQARFMRAVAHVSKFASKVGVSQSVGKDFEAAEAADEAKKAKHPDKSRRDKLYTKGK